MQIQAVGNTVRLDVLQQGFLEDGVVVAVIQRAGTTEEVEVLSAVFIVKVFSLCFIEYTRKCAAVTHHF